MKNDGSASQLPIGQWREFAAAVMRQLPTDITPKAAQMLIERPLILGELIKESIGDFAPVEFDQDYGAEFVVRSDFRIEEELERASGMKNFCADYLAALRLELGKLEGRRFAPYILRPLAAKCRSKDVLREMAARSFAPAGPLQLAYAVAAGLGSSKNDWRNLIALRPFESERRSASDGVHYYDRASKLWASRRDNPDWQMGDVFLAVQEKKR